MLNVALVALLVVVLADLALGVYREKRLMKRIDQLERVGILVTPDAKHKDAAVPLRMSPRQKIRYIEEKLRKRAQLKRGEA